MKHIGIQTACSENWNEMMPTDKGAFCQKCVKQVHDFTNKSTVEIKQVFREMMGQEICGRMTKDQELALNAEFEAWRFQSKQGFQRAMVFSLVVVFGLTLFSCSNKQDEQKVQEIQAIALQAMNIQSAGETEKLPVEKAKSEAAIEINEVFYLEETPVFYVDSVVSKDTVVENRIMPQLEELNFDEVNELNIVGGIRQSTEYMEHLLAEQLQNVQLVDENGRVIPTQYAATAFPNPATDRTTFELSVPDKTRFEIGLYDINGKLIREIYSGKIYQGTFTQEIQLTDLMPGIYLLTIVSKEYNETVRISKI